MAIGISDLNRLKRLQLTRSKAKGRFYGNLAVVAYCWVAELVIFFLLKEDRAEIPSLVIPIIAFSCLIPDFIMKLTLLHDETVMDPFLKTRPVSQEKWDRYLSLSHFRKLSNLIMPLAMAPLCLLFMPFLPGLLVLALLYLASVFGGFVVMLAKHRGPYQPETRKKSGSGKVESAGGNYILGVQFRSFTRSKRLRTTVIYLSVLIYMQCILQSFQELKSATIYTFLFIFLTACTIPQYGFAVEANFFNGIWTRPIAVEKLLVNKFRFGILSGSVGFLLCLPICIWSDVSALDLASELLFASCFSNLIIMVDAYNCAPFELFGSAFYNTQGRSSTFKWSTLLAVFTIMGIEFAVNSILPGWKSQVILSAFGIAGLCVYKPYFRWVVSRFMKNRYRYMEKYNSK